MLNKEPNIDTTSKMSLQEPLILLGDAQELEEEEYLK
jgi:hypothetical protein